MNNVQLFAVVGVLVGWDIVYWRTRHVPHMLLGGFIGAVVSVGLPVLYVYSGLWGE